MSITAKDLPKAITTVLAANLVPFIKASPGVGKSQIVSQVAKEYNLKLIDIRLSQYDQTDLNGFPTINENKRSVYLPFETMPIEGDPVPEGYAGWLMFLDEINSAALAVQAAAYKLILDKQVGQYNLHPDVYIVAAGNLATDKAIVNRTSTAMQSRMVHLNLNVNKDEWLQWAVTSDIDHRVISFIEFRGDDLLHRFDPNHNDDTFPCPRTWQFLSDIVKDREDIDTHLDLIISEGTVGKGAAREFHSFIKIYSELPNIKDIMANPESIHISNESSIRYALSGYVASNITDSNVDTLYKFIERLPKEFQVLVWRKAIKTNPTLMQSFVLKEWISKNAQELM